MSNEPSKAAECYFSRSYSEARARFLEAAVRAGADQTSYRIAAAGCETEPLSIDVVVAGPQRCRRTVVLSSGVHGVEGFFGSAVQLAWLERLRRQGAAESVRYVLVHAINPYGFQQLRRVNEDNVDLNRNFLCQPQDYRGAPPAYAELDSLLNPPSPPSPTEPFLLKALWKRWRVGLPTLKQAIAGGQYDYPRGLFFGGRAAETSTRTLQEHFESWIGDSGQVIHLDFHTGLGKYGDYRLLLSDHGASVLAWYADTFGSGVLEPFAQPHGTAYSASGGFGQWLLNRFGEHRYRFATAEFGTYHTIRVLAALRAENRAHFFCDSVEDSVVQQTKAQLRECFCPADVHWRRQVLRSGLRLVDQATEGRCFRKC